MRRIALWFASTVTVVVMLFGYHTSTAGVAASASSQTPVVSSTPTAGSSASPTASTGSTTTRKKPAATKATTKTYTGQVAQTQYGPVQVALDVSSGKVTKVSVLQYPAGSPEDQRINSYALPILVDETVKAQSADIHMVSGATYTSGGYVQSLQSALDQAGV